MRWIALLMSLSSVAAAAPESMPFGPNAIVVPSTKTLFVMTENKTVALVALDLATGAQRWSSTVGVKPIAVRGASLVALDDAGKLVVLDASTGKTAKGCALIPDVTVPFVDGMRTNYAAWGIDDGTSMILAWTRSTHYVGGVAPSPEVQRRATSHTEGFYKLDLDACKATPIASAPATGVTTTKNNTKVDVALPTGTATIIHDKSRFTLTPPKGKPIDLTEGDTSRNVMALSVDHAFVAIGSASEVNKSTVFELATGAKQHPKLSQFPDIAIYVGATVVMYGNAITAVDGKTGKQLWQVAPRDTRYHGSYPP